MMTGDHPQCTSHDSPSRSDRVRAPVASLLRLAKADPRDVSTTQDYLAQNPRRYDTLIAALRNLSRDYETLQRSAVSNLMPRTWEMLKGFVKHGHRHRPPTGPGDSAAKSAQRLQEGIERLVRADLPGLSDLLPRSEQWVFDVVREESTEPRSVYRPDPRGGTVHGQIPTIPKSDLTHPSPRAETDRVRIHVQGESRDRGRTLVRVNDHDVLFSRGELARLLLLLAARHSSDDGCVKGDEFVRESRQKGNDFDHSAVYRAVYNLRRRLREGSLEVPASHVIVVASGRVRLGDGVDVTWDDETLRRHPDSAIQSLASRLPQSPQSVHPGG